MSAHSRSRPTEGRVGNGPARPDSTPSGRWSMQAFGLALLTAMVTLLGGVLATAQVEAQTDVPPAVAPGAVQGVSETEALFAGIPQDGMTLGRAQAPATLWQAEDPQCPVCRLYSETVLPRIVRRDVRTGRARVRLELYPFVGPESDRGARFVVAAGRQDRAFQALDLIYRNLAEENTGAVTSSYLRGIAQAAGLDVERVMRDMKTKEVAAEVRRQERSATRHGALGTPTLWTQRRGKQRRAVSDFTNALAISRQLAQR